MTIDQWKTAGGSRLGVSFEGGENAAVLPGLARRADTAGADTMWLASHLFQRDPMVQATMALSATTRINAALMAISPYAVHPVHAAMAAATLNEHFPGRAVLCLGAGAPGDMDAAGIARPRPVATLDEAIEITRSLLAGEVVQFRGEHFRVSGRALETGAQDVPLVLAATGPKMLQLAGRQADGVLLSAATSIEFVRWSLAQVSEAANSAAGRQVRRIGLVFASVDADEGKAYERLKPLLAFVLRGAHHAANLEMGGAKLDQTALYDAVTNDDWQRATALVSDEVVARHSVSGTPAQVRARLGEYRQAGLDEVVIAGMRGEAMLAETLTAALGDDPDK
ncbi:MAG: LLM class flavin-dependent oxidoreductase [Rhodospirillaceae bacterium]|jgi:5,10-methylenetetrahydromethanopterin reductase|nr:LLM class flavin-dependent oxidoreductase [Rhodospirillaceae bacterium]MBT5896379.1 LLM class flavin-dependent oxidoreductase [Rhodospirillaceae bacterium]MBT7759263.1 LLM class flavin-dependent oxidoreductase [Rhodospirillaceae bacterium]